MWEMLLSCISLKGLFFGEGGMLEAFIESLLEGRNRKVLSGPSSLLLLY